MTVDIIVKQCFWTNEMTMTDEQKEELVKLVDKHTIVEGENETKINGVNFFRASKTEEPVPSVYSPCLCFIVQGEKRVALDKEVYHYGPTQFLAVSADLPMMNTITLANKSKPYLLLKIDIDAQLLSELLLHIDYSELSVHKTSRATLVGNVDEIIGDSLLRLMRLLDSPQEIPVLASQMLREVIYRILLSEYGPKISSVAIKDSNMAKIAKAIQTLKNRINESIVVEELANMVGMSVSSFHTHFKIVTSMSPLQYQKTLRLIEAREMMFTSNLDVATAAYRVGYESTSHFSREYSRMFGKPPGRDIKTLKTDKKIH